MSAFLPANFMVNGRGLTIADGSGVTWTFDAATNTLSVSALSGSALAANSVTNTELADMAQATMKGRAAAAGTGDPQDLTAAQVKTILALAAADISDFNEAAEDAVLGASTNSATISISYNDVGNSWSASITAVPDAVLTSNIPRLDAANAFTAVFDGTAASAGIRASSTFPALVLHETAAAANNRTWAFYALSERLVGSAFTDAGSGGDWLTVDRTSNTIDNVTLNGTGIKLNGEVGFQGTNPIAKPTVSGSRGGNAALASLLTALANYGLITDGTSA